MGRLISDRERQDRCSDDPLHGGAKIGLESFGRRAHLSESRRTSQNSVTAKFAELVKSEVQLRRTPSSRRSQNPFHTLGSIAYDMRNPLERRDSVVAHQATPQGGLQPPL